jgi:hypothetical protein
MNDVRVLKHVTIFFTVHIGGAFVNGPSGLQLTMAYTVKVQNQVDNVTHPPEHDRGIKNVVESFCEAAYRVGIITPEGQCFPPHRIKEIEYKIVETGGGS